MSDYSERMKDQFRGIREAIQSGKVGQPVGMNEAKRMINEHIACNRQSLDVRDIKQALVGKVCSYELANMIGDAITKLISEVELARKTSQYWKAEHLVGNEEIDRLRAELAELRALVSEPVAWMHNKRVDVIHTSVKSLLSDFAVNSGPESMLRPIDKQENYTIPLYARPVPPAAVPGDVAKDAEVGAAIERACRDLPAWCAIEVRVERGSATVSAYNEECDEVLIDECGEESLAEQVDMALTAILAAKEKGQ